MGGSVDGTVVVDEGGGSVMVLVGGAVVGGSGVGVVVWTGGEVVPGVGGDVVPVLRGAVVPTDGWVTVVTPEPRGAVAVLVDSMVEEVEVDEVDEVLDVDVTRVVVGRAVVEVGAWVATCCFGEVSPPVATSNKSAAMATVARAYSPTLKR